MNGIPDLFHWEIFPATCVNHRNLVQDKLHETLASAKQFRGRGLKIILLAIN